MSLLMLLYGLLAAWLAVYGVNSLVLTMLYLWARARSREAVPELEHWPPVTVQLPIYNELHVVERLIGCIAALDYPRPLLQIQVLDDSTDETTTAARLAVACHARQGLNIHHVRRSERGGFKAGALAHGLSSATGELIAIFDADFLPPHDFLRRVIPFFCDPKVGCVQARWDHLNRNYSALTRAQALGVDAHFVVEQEARYRMGMFLNFNGSAGVWRRECIEDAGGWQADTLTEDLDLSYRAQLAGWRIAYLPGVRVPGELPPQFDALRRQQARWAQGSIQVARKVLPPLLHSNQPWWVKLQGALHLTGYLVHPLLLLTLVLSVPLVLSNGGVAAWVPYWFLATAGPPLMCLVALREQGSSWWRELRFAPLLLLIGMGLALNNSLAMARGLAGKRAEFQRTPKFAVRDNRGQWQDSAYKLPYTRVVWYELLLAAAALASALWAHRGAARPLTYWLLIYALSYACVATMSLAQALQAWRGCRPQGLVEGARRAGR